MLSSHHYDVKLDFFPKKNPAKAGQYDRFETEAIS